jgi:hypothetical protein
MMAKLTRGRGQASSKILISEHKAGNNVESRAAPSGRAGFSGAEPGVFPDQPARQRLATMRLTPIRILTGCRQDRMPAMSKAAGPLRVEADIPFPR